MKKIFLIAALAATAYVQKSVAQDSASQSLQQVITAYLDVKNQLTKDNADSVGVYANTLSTALRNVPMDKLSSEQHKIWMKYYEALGEHADKMCHAKDLKSQRALFKDLSTNFYKLLSAMKVNTVTLYYQYCPMVDAYWISDNSKVVNPYYGKTMLNCGSVKETMKANQ